MIVLLSGDTVMDWAEMQTECSQDQWIPVVTYWDHKDIQRLPVFPTEADAWSWARLNLDERAGRGRRASNIGVWNVQEEFIPVLKDQFNLKQFPPVRVTEVEVVPVEWGSDGDSSMGIAR